jgi:hypothetical protein
MPTRHDRYQHELRPLLHLALVAGDSGPLEQYLTAGSALPGPRMNLGLAEAFAALVGAVVGSKATPTPGLEPLLDGWARLPLEAAPVSDAREMLPAVAALSTAAWAVARPLTWDWALGKLHHAAQDRRWRTRELVATGLQQMLAADWSRTVTALKDWVTDAHPLVVRAAAAAVAEPPLLKGADRAADALAMQEGAISWLQTLPSAHRKEEGVPALRQALGFTLSVAVAAAPEAGFALLARLAAQPDPDVRWIVGENLKKNRLKGARWAAPYAAVREVLDKPA